MMQLSLIGADEPISEQPPAWRRCKTCGRRYQRRTGTPAGTKYCSHACRPSNYTLPEQEYTCAVCGKTDTMKRPKRALICSRCRHRFAGQIEHHHLDTQWAARLITATTCDVCGERLRRNGSGGKHQGQVDHDHACCPSSKSCGNCVRAIVCNLCNSTAGAIERDWERTMKVLHYLGKWTPQEPGATLSA